MSNITRLHLSATRRKACVGCVKSKRRCDLILEGCTTCRKRNIDCIYLDGKIPSPRIGRVRDLSAAESTDSSNVGTLAMSPWSQVTISKDEMLYSLQIISIRFLSRIPRELDLWATENPTRNEQAAFVIRQLQMNVKSLITDCQNAFIHPDCQDRMPIIYQDVLSVCSMYLQKTPRNQDTLFRIMDSKIEALLQESVRSPTRVEDDLLALQCLILYQIIRLFDGDVQQRANAERHLEVLDSWTLRLQSNYVQAIRSRLSRSVYSHWVLMESIRRTTMMSVVLRSLYAELRTGRIELLDALLQLPITVNSSRFWRLGEEEWRDDLEISILSCEEYTDACSKGLVQVAQDYDMLLLMKCHLTTKGIVQRSAGIQAGSS